MENESLDKNSDNEVIREDNILDVILATKDEITTERPAVQQKIELTASQQLKIIEFWNSCPPEKPPTINQMVVHIFGVEKDARSMEARAIKEFLANRGIKARISSVYVPKGDIELTIEQKEFISNNAATQTCLEMTKTLFPGKKITNLSQETRTVKKFMETLPEKIKFLPSDDIPSGDYTPPRTELAMIWKINKFTDSNIDPKKVKDNDKIKGCIKACIGYINSYRFVATINAYACEKDRELFEASFISYVHNKDDLSAEERDQYILLSTDAVIGKNIQFQIDRFQKSADTVIEEGEESKRLSMALVEQISNLRKEYNDCVKRQQSLMSGLEIKRSEKKRDIIPQNETMMALIKFVKNTENRNRMMQLIEIKRKQLADECERIVTLDSIRAEIFGITVKEITDS